MHHTNELNQSQSNWDNLITSCSQDDVVHILCHISTLFRYTLISIPDTYLISTRQRIKISLTFPLYYFIVMYSSPGCMWRTYFIFKSGSYNYVFSITITCFIYAFHFIEYTQCIDKGYTCTYLIRPYGYFTVWSY